MMVCRQNPISHGLRGSLELYRGKCLWNRTVQTWW